MIIGFEVSNPFQLKPKREKNFPGFYVMWGWFAFWAAKQSFGSNLLYFHVKWIRERLDESDGIDIYFDSERYPDREAVYQKLEKLIEMGREE